jgi:hypothetical protein
MEILLIIVIIYLAVSLAVVFSTSLGVPRILQWVAFPLAIALDGVGGAHCDKCGLPFGCAAPHRTWYSEDSFCAGLCEHCWESLSPEKRLAYYIGSGIICAEQSPEIRDSIRQAVLAGK